MTQSRYGRRFDEEFKREVAALACRPRAKQEQVARDPGVSPSSVARWKKPYADAASLSTSGVSVQELEPAHQSTRTRDRGPARAEGHPKKSTRHCLGSPARRHGVIRSLANEFPIMALCRVPGVSRSGHYAAQKKAQRPRARDNVRLGAKIKEAFEASRCTCGGPRLAIALRRAGETCGRHRVARLMRVLHRRATPKRRFGPRPTASRHLCPIAPNHLAERPPPARPGEVWQADITYVATQGGLARRRRGARGGLAPRGGLGG